MIPTLALAAALLAPGINVPSDDTPEIYTSGDVTAAILLEPETADFLCDAYWELRLVAPPETLLVVDDTGYSMLDAWQIVTLETMLDGRLTDAARDALIGYLHTC